MWTAPAIDRSETSIDREERIGPSRTFRRLIHFRRLPFIAPWATSSVLFALTVALWVHSHSIHGWAQYLKPMKGEGFGAYAYTLQTTSSQIKIGMFECGLRPGEKTGFRILSAPPGEETWADLGGFIWAPHCWTVTAHYWCLILFTAAFPVCMALMQRRSKPPGLCPTCGYDLRATPKRCPECGAVQRERMASRV